MPLGKNWVVFWLVWTVSPALGQNLSTADSLCLTIRKQLSDDQIGKAWRSFQILDSTVLSQHSVYPIDILDDLSKKFSVASDQYAGFLNHFWLLKLRRIRSFDQAEQVLSRIISFIRHLRNNYFLEEADEFYQSALEWSRKYYPDKELTSLHYQKGMIYHDMGLFVSAKEVFRKIIPSSTNYAQLALEAYASCLREADQEAERDSIFRLLLKEHPGQREFWYYYNWGTCENNLNNSTLADSLFCQAEGIMNNVSVNDQAYLMNKLARASLTQGKFNLALYYNSLGLLILQPQAKFNIIWSLPVELNIDLTHSHLIDLLSLRADIYYTIFKLTQSAWAERELKNLFDNIERIAWLQLLEHDALSEQLVWQDYIVNFFNSVYFQYFYAKKDYQQIWNISELSRAIATNMQRTRKISSYAMVPIQIYGQVILEDRHQATSIPDSLDQHFWSLPLIRDTLIMEKIDVVKYTKLQKELLSRHMTLLEYVWLPGDQGLYLLKLTKSKFEVMDLTPDIAAIRRALNYFADYALNHAHTAFDINQHKRLYELLLQPAEPLTKHLTIMPMGPLNRLSFNTLIDLQSPKDNFLIQNYYINYQLSSTLWYNQSKKNRKSKNNLSITFAPDYDSSYSPLIYNQEEASLVTTLKDHQVLNFNGQTATVEHYLQFSGEASLIHFAAHAQVDEHNYLKSKIILNQKKPPFNLDFQAILNNPIQAQLIVLSGCQTAHGDLRDGEGMVSLINAFTAAGGQAVLSTQWPVHDQITLHLMRLFYQGLEQGLPLDEALAEAQRHFISSAQADQLEPFYWGGFSIWGNSERFY